MVEVLDFQPLEKKYKKVLLIGKTISMVITLGLLASVIYFSPAKPYALQYLWAITIFFILYYIWSFIVTIKAYEHKSYALREKDVVYKTGWLWREMTTVPFNRVQHVSIDQGPVERNFGLSKLKIFTAGGTASDMTIPGLRPETAEYLKEFIVKKTQADEEE